MQLESNFLEIIDTIQAYSLHLSGLGLLSHFKQSREWKFLTISPSSVEELQSRQQQVARQVLVLRSIKEALISKLTFSVEAELEFCLFI